MTAAGDAIVPLAVSWPRFNACAASGRVGAVAHLAVVAKTQNTESNTLQHSRAAPQHHTHALRTSRAGALGGQRPTSNVFSAAQPHRCDA
eukprot:scaffold907_cov120-Isochrysis_galbana.AAC.5